MNKLVTKEEKGQKDRRNKIILGVILVGIMVVSTAGYAFFSNEKIAGQSKIVEYKGLKFSLLDNGFWYVKINEYEFFTKYNPKDTENITSHISLNIKNYAGKPLYFSQDSDRQCSSEIARNTEKFSERLQFVCLENCTEDYPIKNCSDNIIIIRKATETLIRQEDSCIYILTNEDDALRACDAFIFKILGI